MSLQNLVTQARSLVATVSADPQKYKDALASGIQAISAAKDLYEKLSSGDPAAVAQVQATLDKWDAVAKTTAAADAVEQENAKDAVAITLDEVEQGIGLVVKVAIAVAGFAV